MTCAMLFFMKFIDMASKGLQHLKIREGEWIYEELTFGELF